MANPNFAVQGWVSRLLSNRRRSGSDGVPSDPTGAPVGQYQEPLVIPLGAGNNAFVDEGSYNIFGTAISTGIATLAAVTAYAATSPFIIIQNNEPVGGRSLMLDYIRLGVTAAPTGSTALFAATQIDYISRYTSGATLIVNAAGATGGQVSNPKSSVGSPTTVSVWAGPLVAAAVGPSVRNLAPVIPLKGAIMAVGDNYTIKFGAADTPPASLGAGHAGVILDPGASFLLFLWSPAQTVSATYSVEVGAILR